MSASESAVQQEQAGTTRAAPRSGAPQRTEPSVPPTESCDEALFRGLNVGF